MGRADDSFQEDIWNSVRARAGELGVEAIGFFGHGLGAPWPNQETLNVVYRMAGPDSLDALVVLANTVGNFEDPAVVAELVASSSLPAVSIGVPLEGMPCVSGRGDEAMGELVRHLARVHGRRRFALVTGPLRHAESVRRERAFRQAIAAEGLAFDEALHYQGKFFKVSGAEAVRKYIGEGTPFDAVVCLNDYMAMGAIEELGERGFAVPAEVSVTGFDDVREARWVSPPLTTVRQPLALLGRTALDMALELLDGRGPGAQELECACVFRQSCGCPSEPPSPDLAAETASQLELKREVGKANRASERFAMTRECGVRLLGTFSIDAVVREWELSIRSMGVRKGCLVLFKGPVEPGGRVVPERSRLVASVPGPARGVAYREFPTSLLLPPGIEEAEGRASWTVEPLAYQDEALGYLLIECGAESRGVYETLRQEVSSALKGALLMEEIRAHRNDLERQVSARTAELRRANEDLRSQIERRKVLEREVQEISNRTMQSIGQDIHDDLCQHLAGVSMLAAVVEETLATTGSVAIDSIREIRELLESSVSRSRQYATTLYPPDLRSSGLVSSLEGLVESMRRTSGGMEISFQAEGEPRIEDPSRGLQLYRIVQEALSNAARHSGSDIVVLRVFAREGMLVAEVRDFGRGIEPGLATGGMGLRIMRYRAESIGARLEVRNLEPGVCVSLAVPSEGG